MLTGLINVPREIQAQPISSLPSPYLVYPHPIVWRAPFLTAVVADLVSWSNPTGGNHKI